MGNMLHLKLFFTFDYDLFNVGFLGDLKLIILLKKAFGVDVILVQFTCSNILLLLTFICNCIGKSNKKDSIVIIRYYLIRNSWSSNKNQLESVINLLVFFAYSTTKQLSLIFSNPKSWVGYTHCKLWQGWVLELKFLLNWKWQHINYILLIIINVVTCI